MQGRPGLGPKAAWARGVASCPREAEWPGRLRQGSGDPSQGTHPRGQHEGGSSASLARALSAPTGAVWDQVPAS